MPFKKFNYLVSSVIQNTLMILQEAFLVRPIVSLTKNLSRRVIIVIWMTKRTRLKFLGKRLSRSIKTPTILVVFQISENHITWITLVWTEAVYGSTSLACHWQKPLDFNEVVLDMYFYNFTLSTSQIYHNFIVGLSSLVNATREKSTIS